MRKATVIPHPAMLAEVVAIGPPRPWLIAGTLSTPNRLLKSLWIHIQMVCLADSDAEIDCPQLLADRIDEWLATDGIKFKGCRPDAVVCLSTQYYETPALGIYYRNTNNIDLITVAGIAFRENAEKAWHTAKPLS